MLNERGVIRVWCRLDNRWGYVQGLMLQKKDTDKVYKLYYLECERLDKLRHDLMQACGFEDYTSFCSYIIEKGFEEWDKVNNRWCV